MDGFVRGGERAPFHYFTSLEAALAAGFKPEEWIAWDKAPAEWKAQTVAAGQRGKDNRNTQQGPVPSGRDPFNPAPGAGANGPLKMQKQYMPGGTTAVNPNAYEAGDVGDPDEASEPKSKTLQWVKDYGPIVLGGMGLGLRWWDDRQQRKREEEREKEADEFTQQATTLAMTDWNAREPFRAFATNNFADAAVQRRPDLAAAFADPSNPFYKSLPAGGPPQLEWDPGTGRFVPPRPSPGLPDDWRFKNYKPRT